MTSAQFQDEPLHTQSLLDFSRIKELVANHALTELGMKHILALNPDLEKDEIRKIHAASQELARYLSENRFPPIEMYDFSQWEKQIRVENSTLGSLELFHIKVTLESCVAIRQLFQEKSHSFPTLAACTEHLTPIHPLMNHLDSVFDGHGNIKDEASPELHRIRQKIKATGTRIKTLLQNLASSAGFAQALEDREPVHYENRFVFRVKSSFKNRVKGIIHGSSSSGQSSYIEPDILIPENNAIIQLHDEEEMEIYRILHSLTAEVREQLVPIGFMLNKAGQFDHFLANAHFAEEMHAVFPDLSTEGEMVIRNGRHPFVKNCVPMTIRIEPPRNILVISGPNTGGKTVALKIAGIFSLMLRCGFPVPADPGTRIPIYDNIVADLGDEQSIENDLSTFSGHIMNMKKIDSLVTAQSLVLIDEPGIGTEPEFGEALAEAFLMSLADRSVSCIVTTHYKRIKLLALTDSRFRNASVDYDKETLSPLFRLLYDVPGDSNPQMIMRRIGFPEHLMERTKRILGSQSLDLAETVRALAEQKNRLESEAALAARQKSEYEQLASETQIRYDALRRKEQELRKGFSRTAKEFLHEIRSQFERIVKEIQEKGTDKERIRRAKQLFSEVEEFTAHLEKEESPHGEKKGEHKFQVGDKVRVPNQRYEGEILAIKGEEAVLLSGIMRTTVPLKDLTLSQPKTELRKPSGYTLTSLSTPKQELDLRGHYQSEAQAMLENYFDSLLITRMPFVRIIHGKGSGRLREMVRNFLKDKLERREIRNFYSPKPEQGGDGVTIIEF